MTEWTSLSLIQWTTGFFEKKGIPNPRLDAELLLAHVLKCKRIDLYMQFEKIISEKDRTAYRTLVERRATREPLQYILGETEFWGLTIKVTPDVLIPRPETELLVEEIVKRLKAQGSPLVDDPTAANETPAAANREPRALDILEIGAGTGCISIALAKNLPQSSIIATDISPKALEVARQNIRHHALDARIKLTESNLAPWEDFQKTHRQFDLMVSNPPYIPADEITALQPEVSQHEPHLALSGGESGLDIIEKIHEHAIPFLKPQACLMMEIGEGQAQTLKEKYENHPMLPCSESVKDYQGIERIVIFQKKF